MQLVCILYGQKGKIHNVRERKTPFEPGFLCLLCIFGHFVLPNKLTCCDNHQPNSDGPCACFTGIAYS